MKNIHKSFKQKSNISSIGVVRDGEMLKIKGVYNTFKSFVKAVDESSMPETPI